MGEKKKYRLTPELEEEIERSLRPEVDRQPIRITLVFGHPIGEEDTDVNRWTVPPILQPRIRRTVTNRRFRTYWADFALHEVHAIFEAYQAIDGWPRKEIWIQDRPVPYGAGLWLPLLYFYLVESPEEF